MTIIPQCVNCVFLAKDSATCAAFPQGIPEEILNNEVDHRKPVDGDNGVQFSAVPGKVSVFAQRS